MIELLNETYTTEQGLTWCDPCSVNQWTDEYMDRRIDRYMVGWMGGLVDGWIDN